MVKDLRKELQEIIGMPVDSTFKEVLKYTVFSGMNIKLHIVDTSDIDGFIAYVDGKGKTRARIEIAGLTDKDFRFYEKSGLGHVVGIVKNAYVI